MSAIGMTLKEARNKKAVSLEDVHAKTKIHPRVLQLLEDEKFDKLPSPLFVKSFLKAYAEFLEINPQELLQTYEKEGQKEPEQVLFIKSTAQRVNLSPRFDKKLLVIPGILAAVFLILFVLVGMFKAVGGWISKAKTPASVHKTTVSKTSRSPSASPKIVSSEWLYQVSQGDFPKLNEKTPLQLKIHAQNDVWLRVTCDGKVLFESILKKGANETWEAEKAIELWTGNASNMQLSINGTALKPSTNKSAVKKMRVVHTGIKIVA